MSIIIQKFGGTSLSSFNNREKVCEKIIAQYSEGHSVVVVVSAIGRKGDPYATDSFLHLINSDKIKNRELDLLLSCGEIISGVVLSNQLAEKGMKTHVLTGGQAGIYTNDDFNNAQVLKVLPQKILEHLSKNKIVIVTGFQGITEDGDITTLGRGGSDTTALILGEALNCEWVEIYTDVDGIMTADPRIVPEAKVIETICYPELYQLAEDGAKVIHPRAVEIAERSNIMVKIKNTLNDHSGTLVTSSDYFYKHKPQQDNPKNQIISAITYKAGRTQVTLKNHLSDSTMHEFMDALTAHKISIDLINFLPDEKLFTIDHYDTSKTIHMLKEFDYTYTILEQCCKVSIIGQRMRGVPGIMSKIIDALYKEQVQILQTSDSHTTIWCLIREEDLTKAIRALHKVFGLGEK